MGLPIELIKLEWVFCVECVERHFVMKLDELAKFDKHFQRQNLKPNYHFLSKGLPLRTARRGNPLWLPLFLVVSFN